MRLLKSHGLSLIFAAALGALSYGSRGIVGYVLPKEPQVPKRSGKQHFHTKKHAPKIGKRRTSVHRESRGSVPRGKANRVKY